MAVVVGAAMAWTASGRTVDRDASRSLGALRPVLANGFDVDTVYRMLAIAPFRAAVRTVVRVDNRVVAPAVQAAGKTAVAVGSTSQRAQRGDAQRYLSAALTAVVVAVVLILVAVAT